MEARGKLSKKWESSYRVTHAQKTWARSLIFTVTTAGQQRRIKSNQIVVNVATIERKVTASIVNIHGQNRGLERLVMHFQTCSSYTLQMAMSMGLEAICLMATSKKGQRPISAQMAQKSEYVRATSRLASALK